MLHLSLQTDKLYAGEVGYLAASIKAVADARVGDTITLKKQQAQQALPGTRPHALHSPTDHVVGCDCIRTAELAPWSPLPRRYTECSLGLSYKRIICMTCAG